MVITRVRMDPSGLVATIDGVDWVLAHHVDGGGDIVVDGDGQTANAVRAWLASGGVLTPFAPPPVDLAAVKADAKRRVTARADEIAEAITGTVPLSERLSWPTKEMAARAVLAGTATAVQQALLAAEAQVIGETVPSLASRIVANADAYIVAAGLIAGQRRKVTAAIDALTDPVTLDADLAAIFATAEQEAQALLASL